MTLKEARDNGWTITGRNDDWMAEKNRFIFTGGKELVIAMAAKYDEELGTAMAAKYDEKMARMFA